MVGKGSQLVYTVPTYPTLLNLSVMLYAFVDSSLNTTYVQRSGGTLQGWRGGTVGWRAGAFWGKGSMLRIGGLAITIVEGWR